MPPLRRGWDRLIPLQLSPRARQRRLIFARVMGRTARARCTENAEIEQKGPGNRNFDFREQWSRDELYGAKIEGLRREKSAPVDSSKRGKRVCANPSNEPLPLTTTEKKGSGNNFLARRASILHRDETTFRLSFNGHNSRRYVKLISRRGYLLSFEYRNYIYATFWPARVLLSWLRCAIRAT